MCEHLHCKIVSIFLLLPILHFWFFAFCFARFQAETSIIAILCVSLSLLCLCEQLHCRTTLLKVIELNQQTLKGRFWGNQTWKTLKWLYYNTCSTFPSSTDISDMTRQMLFVRKTNNICVRDKLYLYVGKLSVFVRQTVAFPGHQCCKRLPIQPPIAVSTDPYQHNALSDPQLHFSSRASSWSCGPFCF